MRVVDLNREAAICRAMAEDLKTYLLKDVLYWKLSDSGSYKTPYPRLTLGGLLLRLHHLGALGNLLTPAAYEAFSWSQSTTDALLSEWRVRFEVKLLEEVPARMRQWSVFLMECRESKGQCADEYPTQAVIRTMVELLLKAGEARDLRGIAQMRGQVRAFDERLVNQVVRNPFVWDVTLEAAYPEDDFWWLYVIPRR